MKIQIAVPTYENIFPDVFKAIYDMDKGGHEVLFDTVRGYDCATARNNCARIAMKNDADFLLMIDNDVRVKSDALVNLLDDVRDVTLGYYKHRDPNNPYVNKTSICKLGQVNYTWQYTSEEVRDLRESGQYKVEIHGGGLGCALIKVDVFRKMTFPYFDWLNYENGQMLSEDLYFCEHCRIVQKLRQVLVYTTIGNSC